MLQSVFLAFTLYSRIPVPQVQWNEKNMRYCICFLPLVGAVIGAAQFGMFLLLEKTGTGPVLRGTVLAALPVLLSGGIHMDGFMDTCDAIHSWKSREERLRILKDPHTGAFAVLGCVLYMLVSAGVWTEVCGFAGERGAGPAGSGLPGTAAAGFRSGGQTGLRCLLSVCLCLVLSRALSAFAAVAFPKAKKDGMLRQETDPAASGTATAMGILSLLLLAALILVGGICGVCAAAAAVVTLLYYYRTAVDLFGGTTGDLAGWFLQLCELLMLTAIVLSARIMGV